MLKEVIDVLVLHKRLWVLVIESKRQEFSLSVGMAQLLAYMVANPDSNKPTFGLLTIGGEFHFVKLTRQDTRQYAFSQSFNLRNSGNEL